MTAIEIAKDRSRDRQMTDIEITMTDQDVANDWFKNY